MVLKWAKSHFAKEKKMKKIKPTTKRKIAGIIAVVLVLAMVLSAVLPLFLRTAYADEPQQFTTEASVGLSGAVKINNDAPVSIKVTNNASKTFKGRAVIKTAKSPFEDNYSGMGGDSESKVEYFADIELGGGETRQIDGIMPINAIYDGFTIALEDNKGKSVQENEFTLTTDSDDSCWLGVMSDSDRTRNAVAADFTAFGQTYDLDRLVEFKKDDLDCIDNVEILLINDFDMNSLTHEDITKLRKWVDDGNTLVIGAENYESQTWFSDLTSSMAKNEFSVSDGNSGFGGEDTAIAQSQLKTALASISINNDDEWTIEDAAYYMDAGQIYKLAGLVQYYDVSADHYPEEIAEYFNDSTTQNYIDATGRYSQYGAIVDDLYDEVCYEQDFQPFNYFVQYNGVVKPQESSETQNGRSMDYYTGAGNGAMVFTKPDELVENVLAADLPVGNSYYNPSSSRTMSDFDLEKPQEILGSIFLAVIMLYAVFIGPILYTILKKKDRKESAVKYIPLSALCLTGIIIVCSLGSKFQRPLSNVVNIIDAKMGVDTEGEGTIITASPAKNEVNVKGESLQGVRTVNNRWRGTAGNYSASLTDFDFTFHDATKWQTKQFVYKPKIELGGALSARYTDYSFGGNADIEITNNTGYDLEDVCVSGLEGSYSNYCVTKKLKNGETFTFSYDTAQNRTWSVNDPMSKARNNYSRLGINKRLAVEYVQINDPAVVGFIKSDAAGVIKINGRRTGKTEITALYTNIDYIGTGVDISGAEDAYGGLSGIDSDFNGAGGAVR